MRRASLERSPKEWRRLELVAHRAGPEAVVAFECAVAAALPKPERVPRAYAGREPGTHGASSLLSEATVEALFARMPRRVWLRTSGWAALFQRPVSTANAALNQLLLQGRVQCRSAGPGRALEWQRVE